MARLPTICPVCHRLDTEVIEQTGGDYIAVNCRVCSRYNISRTAHVKVDQPISPKLRALLSHWLRRADRTGPKLPMLTTNEIEHLTLHGRFGSPKEQGDSFLLALAGGGDAQLFDPGKYQELFFDEIAAVIGSPSRDAAKYVVDHLSKRGLIEGVAVSTKSDISVRLTFEGWDYVEKIQRALPDSTKVFMAMQFGEPSVAAAYEDFKVACRQTGFTLAKLDDPPSAGHIDMRMLVEIAKAHFVIADLTKQNRGAYWEAGIGQGMGKQVIYTCHEDEFNEAHFDTAHYLMIKWHPDRMEKAANELKLVIRATFPTKAKLEDN